MKLNNFPYIVGIAFVLTAIVLIVDKCTSKTIIEPLQSANVTQVDSLQHVIDSLQTEIEFQNKGFDSKEHRYEDILFEYEFGIEYLEKYHPEAYRDFHRIIGFKERFRREDVLENKKRLHVEKD